MKSSNYFRFSLAVPLVVPMAIFALAAKSGLGHALVWALILGTMPYVIVATMAWRRAPGVRTRKQFAMISLAAPVAFTVLQISAWLIWQGVGEEAPEGYRSVIVGALSRGCLSLGFGYAYVAVTTLIFLALRSIGWVRTDADFKTY